MRRRRPFEELDTMNAFRPLWGIFLLTAACSSSSDLGTNDPWPNPNGDAGPDANGDAAPNTNSDAGPDTNTDAGPTTNTDAAPDTMGDAAPDTNGDVGPSTNSDAGHDAIGDVGPDATGVGTLSGILSGAFELKSGYAHFNNDNSIDIILSDFDGACASAAANSLHRGETTVQAYGLTGTAPGVFTSTMVVKYATIGPMCAPGTRANFATSKYGRATVSKVTLSKVTATQVEGQMSATFDDGGYISGTFIVPTCASVVNEFVVCY
jgi:hypothetical protein